MTLIVEDGTSKPNAESYISVSDADLHHIGFGNAAWASVSEPNKEIALRKATDYMVATFRGNWKGTRTLSTQALDWPRYNVYRDSWDLINQTEVPVEVMRACAELALISTTTALMPTAQARGKKRVKVGPLEVEYDGLAPTGFSFISALRRLGPLLKAGGMSGFQAKTVRA